MNGSIATHFQKSKWSNVEMKLPLIREFALPTKTVARIHSDLKQTDAKNNKPEVISSYRGISCHRLFTCTPHVADLRWNHLASAVSCLHSQTAPKRKSLEQQNNEHDYNWTVAIFANKLNSVCGQACYFWNRTHTCTAKYCVLRFDENLCDILINDCVVCIWAIHRVA